MMRVLAGALSGTGACGAAFWPLPSLSSGKPARAMDRFCRSSLQPLMPTTRSPAAVTAR
ncbi:hypothetical protein D3C76_1588850 [compost metagenome]